MAQHTKKERWFKSTFLYPIQGILIYLGLVVCRTVPLTWAAGFGAFMFRTFGPYLRADRIARRNLNRFYPDKTPDEIDEIVRGVWDNLGRGAGEWAQMDKVPTTGPKSRVEMIGEEYLNAAISSKKAFIIFTGHLGNWEISSAVMAERGAKLVYIYRKASNPWIEKLFIKVRGKASAELVPKGREGAKRLVQVLREGKPLGVLVDQKLNEGMAIPFFGVDAMTATAPADFALRLKCPLIPMQVVRLPGSRYRVIFHPPMELPEGSDKQENIKSLLTDMNSMLESWIRERPEQWFWVHKRWPD